LYLSPKVLFDIASRPLDDALSADQLLKALKQRGAKMNDFVDEDGIARPAWQEFGPQTGKCTFLVHCQMDRYQDPSTGEPAWQQFHACTGKLTYAVHYNERKIQDPASRDPAWQEWGDQGRLIRAISHRQNMERELTNEEVAILNGKGLIPLSPPPTIQPVPPILSRYVLSKKPAAHNLSLA
jgi:hypothetical protein